MSTLGAHAGQRSVDAPGADLPAMAFERERARLFGLAYRMLGSVGDAEDLVQDAYLRWRRVDVAEIVTPRAYLTTLLTRLCIDRLRHLQLERAHYPGPWLPEPLVAGSPELEHERDETLSLAMLRMLERLAPHERAVFVLREALDLEYAEIAAALDAPPATCRQWYRRARRHLAGERRFDLAPAAQMDVLRRLQAALQAGDVNAIVALLDPAVEARGDGGGKVRAFVRVVTGVERVATVLLHLHRKHRTTQQPVWVNGGLGIAQRDGDGALMAITTIEVANGRLLYFDAVRNPDKLAHIMTASGPGMPAAPGNAGEGEA